MRGCWYIVLWAAAGIACGAQADPLPADDERIVAALPVVPAGLNAGDSLEIQPAQTITAVYDYTVSAPDLRASEWVLFMPRPPAHSGQRILDVSTSPGGETTVDLGPLRQPLLRARVPVTGERWSRSITYRTTVAATLYSRRLIHGADVPPKVPFLSEKERHLFLRRTPQFDYTNAAFTAWAASNNLKRGATEGEVAFARRAFQYIVRNFTYEYLGKQDRSAPGVCSAGKSDCGGMAVLFATVLRSQGIPARTLAGRWAISEKPDDKIGVVEYHQEHVKAEFFAQGVGWVPADLSSAVLHDKSDAKLTHFGNDRGDFLTFHFDNDLTLDTLHFGSRTMNLMQKASYWVKGSGSLENTVIREKWIVKRQP